MSGLVGDNGYNQTTLTYSSGPGFMRNINNQSTDPYFPWHDSSKLDIHDKNFRQAAINPMEAAAHGGEDVAVYAKGSHFLLIIIHSNYKICNQLDWMDF